MSPNELGVLDASIGVNGWIWVLQTATQRSSLFYKIADNLIAGIKPDAGAFVIVRKALRTGDSGDPC